MLLSFLLACKAPPPAPEGLNAASKHLIRNFYADDEELGAGLTGLMDWFDADGHELLDEKADLASVGAFTLDDLTPDDIAHLPIQHDNHPKDAVGVVSLAEMDCHWTRAEKLLTRPDQAVVFSDDFDSYDRTYLTSRDTFESSTNAGEFPKVKKAIEDIEAHPEVLLLTENDAAATDVGVTLEFDLVLQLRHGRYEIQGEERPALVILTYNPKRHEAGGGNSMEQSYSIEANVSVSDKKTLRVFATWAQVESPFLGDDSNIVKTSAVNKSLKTSERMSAICSGEESVE